MIEATVVADSISPAGKRLTTFKLRYPKFIHGEFMTHRVISRNASSSRAIPTAKLLEEVRSDALRAAPVFWGKNQAGMQAAEELNSKWNEPLYFSPLLIGNHTGWHAGSSRDAAEEMWAIAAMNAAQLAEELHKIGAHKQIVNRLLEPFSHINVVATATEWDNFFGLRLHADAQPEMRALAAAMWDARQRSEPKLLDPGYWHLPFTSDKDFEAINIHDAEVRDENALDDKNIIRVSVARCARVSYESFETGKRSTVEEDLNLYDRLTAGLRDPSQPLHASPMEHQATPDEHLPGFVKGALPFDEWMNPSEHGNFVGWRQYRKMIPNEAVAPLPPEYRT